MIQRMMPMRATCLACGLAALLGQIHPVAAEIYRDSDGEVISVTRGGYGWVYRNGGYILTFRGVEVPVDHVVDFNSGGAGAVPTNLADGSTANPVPGGAPPVVTIGGTDFRVEARANGDVILQDIATGRRYATERSAVRANAGGKRINPRSYGLD